MTDRNIVAQKDISNDSGIGGDKVLADHAGLEGV